VAHVARVILSALRKDKVELRIWESGSCCVVQVGDYLNYLWFDFSVFAPSFLYIYLDHLVNLPPLFSTCHVFQRMTSGRKGVCSFMYCTSTSDIIYRSRLQQSIEGSSNCQLTTSNQLEHEAQSKQGGYGHSRWFARPFQHGYDYDSGRVCGERLWRSSPTRTTFASLRPLCPCSAWKKHQ
jgi:hypothetical protein